MSNCTQCHEIGEAVHNQKCLDCHTEIKELIQNKRGYHSSREVSGKDCSECHSEHHGRNFRIINFNKEDFDHSLAGYNLTGKHKEIECEKCHQSKFIDNADLKKKDKTFLGLGQSCILCHDDFHQNTLSTECENCHNTAAFRPAPKFEHNNSRFKLLGAHKKVECISCHKTEKREGRDFQVFKGLKFSSCFHCHTDIHNGRLGTDCERCHSVQSFTNVQNLNLFDHSKTSFSLIGKHLSVKCEGCHKGSVTKKIKHDLCNDCHADYHKGEFTNTVWGINCEECHNVDGFRPSLFSIEKHSKTDFPLLGSHLAYPCESCHLKTADWKFRIDGGKCINCHENVHGNTISDKYLIDNNCEGCHNVKSWNSITFSHSLTSFELEGRHNKISCGECHTSADTEGNIKFVFSSLSSRCQDCHEDIHLGQFQVEETTNCEKCHSFENWNPVKFNHETSRFPLEGAHKNVECGKCHKLTLNKGNRSYTQYKFDDIKCANCHL